MGGGLQRDPITYALIYRPDPKQRYPVYFLVRGDSHAVSGPLMANLHLFGLGSDAPKRMYLFGADRFSRDLFSRVLKGSRASLVGLFGIALSFILGTIIGGISGYYGGKTDNLIQRFIELLRSFPRVPLWPMTSWGLLLKDAQTFDTLSTHPWLLLPGLFIILAVLAFNFVGDGIRDAFDADR